MVSKRIICIFLFFSFFMLAINPTIMGAADINTAIQKYNDADQKIIELQSQGYPTQPLIDLLTEAENYYNLQNYEQSEEISNQALLQAERIVILKSSLDSLSKDIEIINFFGEDTTTLELSLLYAKSDFEAANIDLSENETSDTQRKAFLSLQNISKPRYEEIQEYKDALDGQNKTEDFFTSYFLSERKNYYEKRYADFLQGYKDFESIQGIIEEKNKLEKNIIELQDQNVSFKRLDDSLEFFLIQLNASEYQDALKTITELNMLAKTALSLTKEMQAIKTEYDRLEELEILDNNTIRLYNSISAEYSLENYDEAKKNLDETRKTFHELETENIIFGGIQRARLKKGIKESIMNNWKLILALAIILMIAYNPAKKYLGIRYHTYKCLNQKIEKDTIAEMQKELQKQYYIEHSIDKKTYHEDFQNFEERKTELVNTITILEGKIADSKEYLKNIKDKLKKLGFSRRKTRS